MIGMDDIADYIDEAIRVLDGARNKPNAPVADIQLAQSELTDALNSIAPENEKVREMRRKLRDIGYESQRPLMPDERKLSVILNVSDLAKIEENLNDISMNTDHTVEVVEFREEGDIVPLMQVTITKPDDAP